LSAAAALVWHQFRYDQKIFWRNPGSVFFTVLLPVLFLVIFQLLFGGQTVSGRHIKVSTYYVPSIITLGVISATAVNLAINLTREREAGLMKRARGTPLPAWVFIAGRVGNAVVVASLMLVLVAALGRIAYGVAIPWSEAGPIIATLVVGAASFCAIGIALTTVIPSFEAAPAITQAVFLPLYFLSGVFIPDDQIPSGVLHVASIFPIRHFFLAFINPWVPSGSGFDPGDLALVAMWGGVALVVALRRFRWAPAGT
jgi:ABC-2 type transport system permease protein